MTFHHSLEFQNAIEAAALYHQLQPAMKCQIALG